MKIYSTISSKGNRNKLWHNYKSKVQGQCKESTVGWMEWKKLENIKKNVSVMKYQNTFMKKVIQKTKT